MEIETYFDALKRAMTTLGSMPKTYFIGQAVGYPGTAMYETLKGVPEDKRLELPVAEEMQMGISLGLSLAGFIPVSIYPRWNFLMCAMSGLINHVDKLACISDYSPHIIIRVGMGSVLPLDPQWQHKGDFTEEIKSMCRTARVLRLDNTDQIASAYYDAYQNRGVHILCEVSDFLNEDFYQSYAKFNNIYGS